MTGAPALLTWLSFIHERRTMPRRLPPLNALKAFEVAARSENFTRAAEELDVTQGAVSQQVKALEGISGSSCSLASASAWSSPRPAAIPCRRPRCAGSDCRRHGASCSAQTSGVLRSAPHRTSPPSGSCTGLDGLPRPIPISTSASPRRPSKSISTRGCRSCDPAWRRPLGRARCRASLLGAALAGLRPKLLSGRNRITKASDLLKLPLLRLDDWKTWSKWFEAAGVSAPAGAGRS